MRVRGFFAAVVLTCSACAQAALADPVETSFAITINPLVGGHAVNGGTVDRITFAPLPLGEIVVRMRNESVRIEGLPPVTLTYGGSGRDQSATTLSLVNGTYRHAFGGGWFVGAGQTVYDQSTTYGLSDDTFVYRRGGFAYFIEGREVQYSRVTGPRFEIGRIMHRGRSTVEFWIGVNERMHGVQYTRIPESFNVCSSGPSVMLTCTRHTPSPTFSDPENAGQIDTTARIATRLSKHGELMYGVRYINYTAHYDDIPGQLADRNVGFAPVIGYRARF